MGLKAHVGFSIPRTSDVQLKVISHFSTLGYHLIILPLFWTSR